VGVQPVHQRRQAREGGGHRGGELVRVDDGGRLGSRRERHQLAQELNRPATPKEQNKQWFRYIHI